MKYVTDGVAGGPAIAEAVFIGGPWKTVHQREHLLRRTCGLGLRDAVFGRSGGEMNNLVKTTLGKNKRNIFLLHDINIEMNLTVFEEN